MMRAPNALVAIDPGNCAGWSVWTYEADPGVLVAPPPVLMACGIGPPALGFSWARHVVVEVPEIRKDGPAPPRDIIVLAMNAGRHVERVRCHHPAAKAYGFFPKRWKGNLSKDQHHAQVKAAMGIKCPVALQVATAAELEIPKSYRHNMWDGVALGLWAVARVGSLKTFSDYEFPEL